MSFRALDIGGTLVFDCLFFFFENEGKETVKENEQMGVVFELFLGFNLLRLFWAAVLLCARYLAVHCCGDFILCGFILLCGSRVFS